MSAQTTQLKRVSDRISDIVKEFCRQRLGKDFYGSELAKYVFNEVSLVAPGSPDRVLRLLRSTGEVEYTLISRGGSVYHVDKVAA